MDWNTTLFGVLNIAKIYLYQMWKSEYLNCWITMPPTMILKSLSMNGDLDHIHLLIEATPNTVIPNIVKGMKGITL